MKNALLVVAALAVIVGSGLVHGAWTNRWGVPPAVKEMAQRIEALPERIGPWTMAESFPLDDRTVAMTGAVGYVSRRYVKTGSNESVNLLVLTGLPGNIGTHTPEDCYPGAGFVLEAPETYTRRYGVPEREAGFQTTLAIRQGTNAATLRLFWSWRSSKGWSSPQDARWAFAAEPTLTKIYVIREIGGSKVTAKDDPCNSFMTAVLPLLDQAVAGQGEPPRVAAR